MGINRIFIFFFVWTSTVFAEDPSPMKQTQQLLKNREQRNHVIRQSPKAQSVDNSINEVVGGSDSHKEEVYNISSEVFGNFEGKSPEEISGILEQASKDPESFYKSLTPEQKKKISNLAEKISDSKKKP